VHKRHFILSFVFLESMLLFCFIAPIVIAQSDQVNLKIQQADNTIEQAFNAIIDAERSGANITILLNQLNDANGALAKAENYYQSGNLDLAAPEADNAVSIAQQVTIQAENTKQAGMVSSQSIFLLTIGFTVVAILILVLALLFLWRVFKKWYIGNLSQAKPKVTSQ
jgi:hypothetical protein